VTLTDLAERRWLPDWLIRRGIRRLLAQRAAAAQASIDDFVRKLETSPIADQTPAANRQHYEVPAEFFRGFLGPRMKYSSGLWPTPTTTLAESEDAMLRLSCERAEIVDGMDLLELGCGWGSLSLWLATQYPKSRILAVSNSQSQRAYIETTARSRGFTNLEVRTCDMNDFDPGRRFDRVLSVEMFEHMRNYAVLLRRIAGWLKPDGKLFVHIFCHQRAAYTFDDDESGDENWMGRHFFSGGIMPSEDLLGRFQADLRLERTWQVDGTHYARTLDAWLANLDRLGDQALATPSNCEDPRRMLQRWRMFLMACAELFGYRGGGEWYVAHYLFRKP
jgi:cyclopropane-fatty-acyl-phospholipid synthase